MITLNLAIYKGDVKVIEFSNQIDLSEYVKELNRFDCIWLAAEDQVFGEILVTENLQTVINHFKLWNSPQNFYLQQYQTYEDAYKVALDMRESNPKCYN